MQSWPTMLLHTDWLVINSSLSLGSLTIWLKLLSVVQPFMQTGMSPPSHAHLFVAHSIHANTQHLVSWQPEVYDHYNTNLNTIQWVLCGIQILESSAKTKSLPSTHSQATIIVSIPFFMSPTPFHFPLILPYIPLNTVNTLNNEHTHWLSYIPCSLIPVVYNLWPSLPSISACQWWACFWHINIPMISHASHMLTKSWGLEEHEHFNNDSMKKKGVTWHTTSLWDS